MYKAHIQRAIDYIEDNLTCDIDLRDCAGAAGYSPWYFLRIFKEAAGLTPADYIRKRRLTEVAKAIADGNGDMAAAAFAWGFNSKENFIRAFKAEHGVLPGEYRRAGNSLKNYERITFNASPPQPAWHIAQLNPITLLVYPCIDEQVPRFWNHYNCHKLNSRLSGGNGCEDYGVSAIDNGLHYYIGIPKELALGDSSGTQPLFLPGGTYAVFLTPPANQFSYVNSIHDTWHAITRFWKPPIGYRLRSSPSFEVYKEDSRSYRERIYIPIEQEARI